MRFRECSTLGWSMLEWLGALCIPFVAREEAWRRPIMVGRRSGMAFSALKLAEVQQRALQEPQRVWPRAGTDSATDDAPPQTRSPGPALPTQLVHCTRCGASLLQGVCMNCDVDPPGEPPVDEASNPPVPSILDEAEDQFCRRLEACGCASPEQAMGEMRWALEQAETGSPGALPMLVLYYLDQRGLIEHGSSLHSAWLAEEGRLLLGWLKEQGVEPVPLAAGQAP